MIRNRRGNTLVELLVASVIVIIAITALTGYVVNLKKHTQRIFTSRSRSVQIQKVVQMLLADPKLFKVNFDASLSSTCTVLDNATLPLAWDNNNVADLKNCKGCPGRLGYTIQPFPDSSRRGIYVVTIRITHPTLTLGKSVTCGATEIKNSDQIQMIVGLR